MGPGSVRRWLACAVAATGLAIAMPSAAAPGDTLFYDNLNGNLNAWTIASGGGDASIGNETAKQGRSMRLRWDTVSASSDPFNAAVPAAELSVWIQRGDDSFSENPENNEDLYVEYRTSGGGWSTLAQYDGGDTPGEIIEPVFALPADALHGALRIRFRMAGGSGPDFDYWHVDEPRVTEVAPAGQPLGLGTCETFESGLGNWTVTGSGDAGTSSQTYNSASNSLYTRGGAVTVTSNPIDLGTGGLVALDVWVRRGDDRFSEDPDGGEDLDLEWRIGGGSWTSLELFDGNGTPGEIYARSYALPGAALQTTFQFRVRKTGGNGGNFDYWHVDDICLTPATPIFFSLDEESWTGTPGEVEEGGGSGLDGTAVGGASTDSTAPAIAGNPGTCRYGDFDGVNDYVEIADAPELDMSSELTVAAWINMRSTPSDLHTVVSKDTNYEFHINSSREIYWWWSDSNGTTRSITTNERVSLNQWHHIAVTYASGEQRIYLDGAAVEADSYTGTLANNDLPFYIGTDWDFVARAFDGYIDEVYLYPQALTASQVQDLMLETHTCDTAAAQFTINHDNFGIHCAAETITVDVIDSVAGTPLLSYDATVAIDTQSGDGTWTLVSGGGAFNDAAGDDGIATYDWPLGESQAMFALYYPQGTPSIDIDVWQQSDTGIRDTDAEGNLVFSSSGFTVTASALANPPPAAIDTFDATQTAAVGFALHLTAYGQTASDPECGVIETYTGPRNLKFWSQYLDPGTGTVAVQIDAASIPASEAAAVNRTVDFTNGQASVAARYKDVGLKQILVKDDTTVNADLPGGIRGATGGFVVRPATFELTAIENAAGTLVNPQATDATGPVFVAAGAPFRATVTALDADGDPTPNFGREADPDTVSLDVGLVEPIGGNEPAVAYATGFGAFGGGSATGYDFFWPEVGIVTLTPSLDDDDYLGTGDVVGAPSDPVGRFVPDHFAVAPNAPLFATECGTSAPGFTYTGEAFDYATAPVLTVIARSAQNSPTVNYTGDYMKLATGGLPARSYSASRPLDTSGVPDASSDPAVDSTGPGVAELRFSGGSGLRFSKGASTAPFNADVRLSIDVIDTDGVAAQANPQVFGAAAGIPFDNGEEIRYGRVRFVNAVGSELVDLAVPLRAEYFAGSGIGFVTNFDDGCTTDVTLGLSNYTENLADGDTCALDTGAPGNSNIGCPGAAPLPDQFAEPPVAGEFNLSLRAPGAGDTGSVTISATVPAWLRFDWDAAAAGDENPSGQAAFGLYKGESRQIYMREIY